LQDETAGHFVTATLIVIAAAANLGVAVSTYGNDDPNFVRALVMLGVVGVGALALIATLRLPGGDDDGHESGWWEQT